MRRGWPSSSQSVTAIIAPSGTVQSIAPYATTATNTYYGTGDYTVVDNAYVPNPGASYGQVKTSVDAAGQETYYGYDASGRTVLQYTFKSWTNGAGVIVYGWVGTTSVYDSAGRLTDTYTATYAVGGYTPGTAIPSLPIVTGGPAGIQIDTSVDPLYLGIQPLHTQHIDYNSLGQQAETVDQYGGTTTNTYDANGNTIETTNPDGTETLTVYDALNRAIWQTNSFDPSNLATAITTRTVYNQLGQVIETQQYAGELITLGTVTLGSAQLPTTTVTTVDGTPNGVPTSGTLLSTTQTFYDAAGNAIETIGANGLRTGTIYNPDGSVAYTGPLNASAPDGGRPVTTYAGVTSNEFSLSDFLVNSSNGYTSTLANQYDPSLGSFYTETINQLGHTTKTYADTLGRTVRTVYDDGSFTETLYGVGSSPVTQDQEGDAIATPTGWVGIPSGGYEEVDLAQRKLGDPLVPTYDLYDADGRLTDVYQPAVIDGDSSSTALVNPHWHYGYDSAGNEISQTSPTGHTASGGYVAGGNTTTFGFDQNDNQVREMLPDGEVETSTFNIYNEMATATDFDGNVATYTYATNYNTPGTDAGDLLSVVYAGNGKATQTVTYTYDDLNRQHTVADASGTTTSSYDIEGDLIESNTPEGDIHYVFNLATGDHTETYTAYTDTLYGYDSQDRLQTVTVEKLNGTTLATPLVTTYTYDAAGNKKTETLPNGEVSTYGYDDLNRLTSLVEVQGNTTLFSETIIVNDDGTRASASETQLQPDGSTVDTDTTWTYDADGRLTSETVEGPGAAPSTSLGLATTVDLPADYNFDGGTAVTLTWDGSDAYLSTGLTESQVADQSNAGEALFDPSAGVAYGGNGSDWVFVVYDQQNYDAQSFTYANGTLTPDDVVTENRDFGSTPTISLPAVASGFDYEDTYTYDLDNNRTESMHVGPVGGANETITYKYNGDDELTSQTSSLSGTTTNTYDANGSLTTSLTGGVTTTYSYDSRNKMVGYTDGTSAATYVYDDDGDRVAETVTTGGTSATTLYLTDTQNPTGYDQPIEQRSSASSAPSLTYVLGDRVLAQANASSKVNYLLVDGHGSTQQLTSLSGAVSEAYRYDAFGSALNFDAATAGTTFLFGGDAIYDSTSGLYLHGDGVRASVGNIFIQRDNFAGISSDPLSVHKYLYANADSVDNSDPTGHYVGLAIGAAGEVGEVAADGTLAAGAYGFLAQVLAQVQTVSLAEAALATAIGSGVGVTAALAIHSAMQGVASTSQAINQIQSGNASIAILASQNIGYLAGCFGIPAKQMGQIIHDIKDRWKGDSKEHKNPDVVIDIDTGDARIEGSDEVIDNVNDYIEGD